MCLVSFASLACSLLQEMSAQSLPKPGASKSVILVPKLVPSPDSFLTVPPGFKVNLFADNLTHPRTMAVAENGDVFVVETRIERPGKQPHDVVVLTDQDRDGRADGKSVWSDKCDMPFGIEFEFGHLYVANTGSIVRWPYRSGDKVASGPPELILDGIPQKGYRNHWTRNIIFSPDKKSMFLTVGSEENVAVEGSRRAVIEKYNLDSSGKIIGDRELFASGMRNPIGLDFQPKTGDLWANVAERDYLGDGLVPDFLTRVRRGGFYGWPYYYIGQNHDPRMPENAELKEKVIVPEVLFTAHTTPIGVKFVSSQSFPKEYQGDALVALHGTQNRSKLAGYSVVRVQFDSSGKPTGRQDVFVTGWLPKGSNKEIYGRPAGLAFLLDGSLLIADDWAGRIWRVSATP